MDDAAIGQVVDGYRIQRVIGRGGMGVVYEAEDVNLSRPVAIKRVNPSQANRDMFLHRFRAEARALARIDSPHIVRVYALRETDIGLLIVMEYVSGGTLEDRVQDGPMPLDAALPLLKQMLTAFADAHSAGVIHRDIKPANIMLTPDDVVKVTDFGIAKMRKQDTGKTVTQGGQGGTLKYMSPEQISNISEVDYTSDVYALGMVAYQMLVGRLPFSEEETDFDIMRKVVEGKLPPPSEYAEDLPEELVELIVTATAQRQKNRYQSTDEMMAVIEEFEAQDAAPEPTLPGPQLRANDEESPPDPEFEVNTSVATATSVPDTSDTPSVEADQNGAQAGALEGVLEDDADDSSKEAGLLSRSRLLGGVAAALLLLGGLWWAFGGIGGASGSLTVATDPEGATVFVDGDSVGTTPLSDVGLAAGFANVRIAKEGYTAVDTSFAVEDEAYVLENITLEEAEVRLGIRTSPHEATVFVNDESIGQTPLDDEVRVSAGTHEIRIERQGYVPYDTTLNVSSDEGVVSISAALTREEADEAAPSPTTADAVPPSADSPDESPAVDSPDETEPEAAFSTVTVEAQPTGTITIDGVSHEGQGQFEVVAGAHEVRCTHPEYGDVTTTVHLQPNQTDALQCFFEHPVIVNSEPWGAVWINGENTGVITRTDRMYLPPGDHDIQVRVEREDRLLNGGRVRVLEGGEEVERATFSGYDYTVTIEPAFVETEHLITFVD